MELRGVTSDKQILLTILEKAYLNALSEKDFYRQLQDQNLELYSRNNKIVGIKTTRKFRFRTLGYSREVLKDLDRLVPRKQRLKELQQIRNKRKDQSHEREE